jgi:hypothetical protein
MVTLAVTVPLVPANVADCIGILFSIGADDSHVVNFLLEKRNYS